MSLFVSIYTVRSLHVYSVQIVPKHRLVACFSSLCAQNFIELENHGGGGGSSSSVGDKRKWYKSDLVRDEVSFSGRTTPILAKTRVVVSVSISEIQAAVRTAGNNNQQQSAVSTANYNNYSSSSTADGGAKQASAMLHLPERVKRAILEPYEPLIYRAAL